MKKLIVLLFAFASIQINAQCPDCTPDETCQGDGLFPAICPEVLPDATAGAYYETVLTFNLPSSVIDPDTELEVELQEVVVTGVSGIPFGVTYETNSPGGVYFPSQGDNYGCATICGTPLIPGFYDVVISVDVTVVAFGIEQSVQESFPLPLTVLPGEGGNTSFSYDNLFGCGEASATFSALIDGSPGVTTYNWDFANGNIGNVANPPAQTYNEPGDYVVTLETIIEDYTLNTVVVDQLSSGWGGDVEELSEALFNPDPYFVIIDGNGGAVYTSSQINDVNSASWNNIGLILNNPPYTIAIYDQDNGGLFGSEDDFLGSASFDLATGIASWASGDTQGSVSISLEISNVFNDEETVQVFPFPNAEFTYLVDLSVLDYDDETLDFFTWTLFGDTIQEGVQDSLVLSQPGVYQCAVTSIYGCFDTSSTFTLCPEVALNYLPAIDLITAEEGFESYQWFFNGLPLDGATNPSVDASEPGNYALTITTDYGCEVTSEVLTVSVGINAVEENTHLLVYPNPASDLVRIDLALSGGELLVYDMNGRIVFNTILNDPNPTLDVRSWEPGIYHLIYTCSTGSSTQKLLVTR